MSEASTPDTERIHGQYLGWQTTIATMAKADPNLRFTTMAHNLTPETLAAAFQRLNARAAPGPDGVTVAEYAENLEGNLHELWTRMVHGTYRASPARRVLIPKPNGKMRPLGIANVEDRVVQTAIAMALEPIYEQDFLVFSHGFRRGRSTKGALEEVRRTIEEGWTTVVFEADIKGFFDNLGHGWLRKFLGHRVADRGLMRLIGKVLKSGVVEDGVIRRGSKGAPQGGPLSPLLANVYLHYVLDLWFDRRFRRSCRGRAHLVRYADDFVVCFEHREDAERLRKELAERLGAFELELESDKTRLIEFDPKSRPGGRGARSGGKTFDFLGFTHYLRQRRSRRRVARLPSRKSRLRFLAEAQAWLRKQMHSSPWFHQKTLSVKLTGFYHYFGLRYCKPYLRTVQVLVQRAWLRTLQRRSQRARRLTWERVKRKPWFVLPEPRIRSRKPRTRPRREASSRQLSLFGDATPST